ncbi:MAG: alpha,6-mannosyltransferase [Acidobacteriaceae bacterium]
MKLGASGRLYGIGAIILAALVISARSGIGSPPFLIGLAVASIAYFLAVLEFFRTPHFPRHVIFICLALAALWRTPFLMMPPGSDDDIHRYLWDGRLQRHGYNPYTEIPADPAMGWLHTPETRGMNHPELPSPYPAGAELFFRGVTSIHESVFALRIAFVVCDFAIVLLLLFDILRLSGQGEHWVLAYAWHPLLATGVAGSGHIDILGVVLLLVSVAALGRRWRTISAIAFSLAVSVKFLPIVLAPLYWRRLRGRDGVMAALVFALLYVPFLKDGHIPGGSLGKYVHSFRFNNPLFTTLEGVASPEIIAGFAVIVGLVIAGWLRSKPTPNYSDQWAWPMAASLAFAPVIYPWYLLWLIPFLRSTSTLPLIGWTLSILPTYTVWYLRSIGHVWIIPDWVLLLEYGSVAITAAIVALRPTANMNTRTRLNELVPASDDGLKKMGADDDHLPARSED